MPFTKKFLQPDKKYSFTALALTRMQLELQNIIPIPLKDKFLQRNSDVWNKSLQFNGRDFVKGKAPSGTGKTTLIHIIYKLRKDFEGEVLWNKKSLSLVQPD